jgi:hypothetical protein
LGVLIVIRITVEVDEDRLREAGTSIAEDVMAELEALRRGGLNLQTRMPGVRSAT